MKKIKFTIVSSHSTCHLSNRYTLTIANIYCSMLRKSTRIKILGRVDITFLMKLIHQPPAPITMHNIPSWWDEYPGPFHNGQSLIFHIKQSWVVGGSFHCKTLKKWTETQFEYYKAAQNGLVLFFFYLKIFGGHMVLLWSHWCPFFTSGDVCSGFQSLMVSSLKYY